MKRAVQVGLALVALCAATLVWAQNSPLTPESYSQLKFRYIGPVGNRADAVAGVPGDPYTYYVGAASGGIFKTSDGGVRWEPIFDSEPVSSIGALAVAATDPNTVWAGTGESFIRSHISVGDGIYKSTDAGKTWTHMGLDKTGRISNVVVDPHNADIVLVCALGHAYGPQPERGVFRTTDGGKTWTRTLFVDENTGCSDLGVDPNNSRVMFAGMWQLEIHTWGRTSGGPGSGLYKSTDGGVTWKKLEGHGLPHAPLGRIAVRVAQKDSHRVYAMIETGDGVPFEGKPTQVGSLWRSDDGGDSWEMINADRQLRGRTAYYTRMEIAPDNENEVHFFSAAYSRTEDGGRSLQQLGFGATPGGDNHEGWIDPTNGDRMAVVNDSGVSITVNRGKSWDRVQLPIAQIYHVTVDDQIPYNVYGNKQDGGSYRGPSNSRGFGGFFGGGISRAEWHSVGGGESGFATPDPVDNNIIWSSGTGSGSVQGAVMVFDERNHQTRDVEVWPEDASGNTAAEVKYRFNWEFPLTISPHDHKKVYVGSQYVHVTTDGGNSWQIISPDLTRNDRSKMGSSGGLTADNIGVEYAGVVFSIAESPKQAGVIWAGTNDGLVQLTRDGGKNWTNVTKNIPDLPEWGTVSNIEASRYDAGTAYITVDFHQMNNRDPFVYKTNDFGKTWTKITEGIPHSMLSYAHCVREDPVRKGLLYLGTENGLYASFDDGGHWQPLQAGLPHAPVYWITVQERFHDLVLSTYGRGFWILDDVTPLEQASADLGTKEARLFPVRDAYRFRPVALPASGSNDPTAGQNPPYGADINFFLKNKPEEKEKVQLTISDASGAVVRTINCNSRRGEAQDDEEQYGFRRPAAARCEARAGVNRFWWDLRSEPSAQIKLRTMPQYGVEVPMGKDGARNAPDGSRISILEPPGSYTVKLTVGSESYTQPLKVLKDPYSTGTDADIAAQTKVLRDLQARMNDIAANVAEIEAMKVQLASLGKEIGTEEVSAPVRETAEKMTGQLSDIEGRVLQLKLSGRGQDDVRWAPMLAEKISYLAGQIGSSDFAPTTQQLAVAEELTKQEEAFANDLGLFTSKDVVAFNNLLRERNAQYIVIPKRTQRSQAAAK